MTEESCRATLLNGEVRLDAPVDWPDGTKLIVSRVAAPDQGRRLDGHVIIAGFGLAGRAIADLLEKSALPYVILEKNPETASTQRSLGRKIVEGSVTDAATLLAAGFHTASILALTIPDEDAVLKATSLARSLRPGIYIIARTTYASKGMQAAQLGADDVVKAEQAVALQFYDLVNKRIGPIGG